MIIATKMITMIMLMIIIIATTIAIITIMITKIVTTVATIVIAHQYLPLHAHIQGHDLGQNLNLDHSHVLLRILALAH